MRVDQHGRQLLDIGPPFSLHNPKDTGGALGGTLDRGILAIGEDGSRVVIGEIWARAVSSVEEAGVSIDSVEIAEKIIEILNDHWEGY